MFIAGILVFLVGVAITIITPDAIALGLTLLIAGVVLVSLSGARRHGAEPHIPERQGAEQHVSAQRNADQRDADQRDAEGPAADNPERTT